MVIANIQAVQDGVSKSLCQAALELCHLRMRYNSSVIRQYEVLRQDLENTVTNHSATEYHRHVELCGRLK